MNAKSKTAALKRVLIANRGEIAIRIAKSATGLGIETVSVFAAIDEDSLHTKYSDVTVEIGNAEQTIDAYLDARSIVQTAVEANCDCIHPGYGFLSESVELAEECERQGLVFIGPSADSLRLFGDKLKARAFAHSLDVPTVPGSSEVVDSIDSALELAEEVSYPVILKAAGGGGGKGMRVVESSDEMGLAFDRCQSEARAAFGNGDVFLERFVTRPRHVEVQILADAQGNVVHLFERDCSVQSNHQKVIEIAPAPSLSLELRSQIREAAVEIATRGGYKNAGTFEFLVVPETNEYFFIECNPRIQVEHTITEQVTGVDLVDAQFRIAQGESLPDIGIANQESIEEPGSFAIQARVVAQGGGVFTAYREPSGPNVRVDGYGYAGYSVKPQFDPLFAKVVCWSNNGGGIEHAVDKTRRVLNEFHVAGVPTNLGQLKNILEHTDVRRGDARTSLLSEQPNLLATTNAREKDSLTAMFDRLSVLHGNGSFAADPSQHQSALPSLSVSPGTVGAETSMSGTVVEVCVSAGDTVFVGDPLVVISAMKMESVVASPASGVVAELQALNPGDTVDAGQVVASIETSDTSTDAQDAELDRDASWLPLLDDVSDMQRLALKRLAVDSEEPGVVRQRSRGKLTCRERIDLLLDDGSFREVGSVAGFASYDENGRVDAFTPANHVGGWGKIRGRQTIVCADDFTSRGGHSDGAIGAKSSYLDRLSLEMRVPSVRLLDGSSGGGSVASMVPAQKKDGESKAKESSGAIKAGRPRVAGGGGSFLPGHLGSKMYADQLATVPVVNMLLGSVVGIGAAKAVLGHFSVMIKEIAQLFVAGPPVVSHAMGYDITKEELGGWHIHCRNGSVDNLAENEEEAAEMTRQFLSYLPNSVYETPPVHALPSSDSVDRREEELLTIIHRKRTTTFDMRKAINLMADKNSFFEIGPYWGNDQITGFVRFNGHVLGVIASDSQHANGGALTADGCSKLTRHLDMCDLFHVPVLNLVDNPGFAVGLEHEIAGTIRRGGEWMVAFAQTRVPIFTVVMRRSFGVAGNNYATPRSSPSMRVAWPAADMGGIPPEGGIEAAYKRQLAESEDPVALRNELMARIESARGPIGPLSRFQVEEMIDPRDTRPLICDWVEHAYRYIALPDQLGPRAIRFRP